MLPFDPAYLPVGAVDPFAPVIRLLSPAAGSVPDANVPVIATVEAAAAVNWELDYAPLEDVDPDKLLEDDPDYASLGTGTGDLTNATLADFPTTELASGIYLLRLNVQAITGGSEAAQALVRGVGIDSASLAVSIEMDAPAP